MNDMNRRDFERYFNNRLLFNGTHTGYKPFRFYQENFVAAGTAGFNAFTYQTNEGTFGAITRFIFDFNVAIPLVTDFTYQLLFDSEPIPYTGNFAQYNIIQNVGIPLDYFVYLNGSSHSLRYIYNNTSLAVHRPTITVIGFYVNIDNVG